MKMRQVLWMGALAAGFGAVQANAATIAITEWMYGGSGGEFVELTNVSGSAIDMTGWSYDDDSATPGSEDLSGFGIVAPGESVILTESAAGDFQTAWALGSGVKIVGGVTNNLGRNDQINIYDASDTLVDRLTYGDQTFSGTIRTNGKSGDPSDMSALGVDDPSLWVLSSAGDTYGSWTSLDGDVGNPGTFTLVPEPASMALLAMGGLLIASRRRRA